MPYMNVTRGCWKWSCSKLWELKYLRIPTSCCEVIPVDWDIWGEELTKCELPNIIHKVLSTAFEVKMQDIIFFVRVFCHGISLCLLLVFLWRTAAPADRKKKECLIWKSLRLPLVFYCQSTRKSKRRDISNVSVSLQRVKQAIAKRGMIASSMSKGTSRPTNEELDAAPALSGGPA